MDYQGHSDQHFGHISYSQHGEDLMIINLFMQMNIDRPSYIDLGAHHPSTISNTALLYGRGSRGINVEANPHLMEAFRIERPRDLNLNIGIDLTPGGFSTFYMFDNYSGLNTFSHIAAMTFSAASGRKILDPITLPVTTLNEIIDTYCQGKFPEFLNCDIEGMDKEIMRQANFNESSPLIICVETRLSESKEMCGIMSQKRFHPYCRMGENVIFIRMEYMHLLAENLGLR